MTDAPNPSSLQWPFGRLAPVRPCLSCSGKPRPVHTTPDVLRPRLSSGEDSPTSLDLVVTLCQAQAGCCWPPMPEGHVAGSRSTWCPPRAPEPLLQSCFSGKHPPGCTGGYLWFLPPQGQDLTFPFALGQEIPAGQDLRPVHMPLNGSTTIWCINQSSYFCHTCKSAEGVPCPIIQVTNEDVKQAVLAPVSTPAV